MSRLELWAAMRAADRRSAQRERNRYRCDVCGATGVAWFDRQWLCGPCRTARARQIREEVYGDGKKP